MRVIIVGAGKVGHFDEPAGAGKASPVHIKINGKTFGERLIDPVRRSLYLIDTELNIA